MDLLPLLGIYLLIIHFFKVFACFHNALKNCSSSLDFLEEEIENPVYESTCYWNSLKTSIIFKWRGIVNRYTGF